MSDQKIEPCQCGHDCYVSKRGGDKGIFWTIRCGFCSYTSSDYLTEAEAIAAHDKVSRNNAAAPDMLAALQYVDYAAGPCKIDVHSPDVFVNVHMAVTALLDVRDAIAKATGETP